MLVGLRVSTVEYDRSASRNIDRGSGTVGARRERNPPHLDCHGLPRVANLVEGLGFRVWCFGGLRVWGV